MSSYQTPDNRYDTHQSFVEPIVLTIMSSPLAFLVQSQQWKQQDNMRNTFGVNDKDTRTTSESFLIKLQAEGPQLYQKRDSDAYV